MAIPPESNSRRRDRDNDGAQTLPLRNLRIRNRYVANANQEENLDEFDRSRALLNIMRDEFPDDPLYRRGRLTPGDQVRQALEEDATQAEKVKNLEITKRNTKNVAQFNTVKPIYEKYELKKSYPTIDEEELDELIDEEFDSFTENAEEEDEPEGPVEPRPSGMFLTMVDFGKEDLHHQYITNGPQVLQTNDGDVSEIFVVYYIHNGKARPIPNYQTLEVMLVEKGLKYDFIRQATAKQIKDFDLVLDGLDTAKSYSDEDDDPEDEEADYNTPYTEYIDRAMADRSNEYTHTIRLMSGYRPMLPFLRDPGDYIKPESMRHEGGRSGNSFSNMMAAEEGDETPSAAPDTGTQPDPTATVEEQIEQQGPGQMADMPMFPFGMRNRNRRQQLREQRRQAREAARAAEEAAAAIPMPEPDAILNQVPPIEPEIPYEPPQPLPLPDLLDKYDPDDMYFDQVFLKQTYREQIREKFEGKMIIARWPRPDYNEDEVRRSTPVTMDDYVNTTRMMVMGHWKQVRSNPALRLYATLNNVDMGDYEPAPPIMGLSLNEAYEAGEGRYGEIGLINLLVKGGAISVLEHEDFDPHPIWATFPHIVEADTDGVPGLNMDEYIEYLDYWSNGGNMFEKPELSPFEPPGSIHYYDKEAYQDYVEQALMQEQIDQIKEQIYDLLPSVSAEIEQMKIKFDSLPLDYTDYCNKLLGPKGPLYKIFNSKNGKYKYKKKLPKWRGGKIKTKESRAEMFDLLWKSKRAIIGAFNENQEKQIVKRSKWMKTVKRDKFAAWMNLGGDDPPPVVGPLSPDVNAAQQAASAAFEGLDMTPILLGASYAATVAIANPIVLAAGVLFVVIDLIVGETPADKYDLPPWRQMRDKWYMEACIYNEIDDAVTELFTRSTEADTYLPWLKDVIYALYDKIFELDEQIARAADLEDFEKILDGLSAMNELFRVLKQGGLLTKVDNLRSDIDKTLVDYLKRQYDAIQYIRKRVHVGVGSKKKFMITWARGPQEILNEYVPGLTFDNYQKN